MTDTTSRTTSTNVQLVRDAYAAFGRGDIEGVVDAMDPEIEWHEAEHSPWHEAGGHHGPQEILANVFARIPEHFESFEVEPLAYHDAGTTVVVEGRYGASAAADDLDAQVCHVWRIRDGRLVGFQQYTDTWQFARVTGGQPE